MRFRPDFNGYDSDGMEELNRLADSILPIDNNPKYARINYKRRLVERLQNDLGMIEGTIGHHPEQKFVSFASLPPTGSPQTN